MPSDTKASSQDGSPGTSPSRDFALLPRVTDIGKKFKLSDLIKLVIWDETRPGRLPTMWNWKQSLETFPWPATGSLRYGTRNTPILGTQSPPDSKNNTAGSNVTSGSFISISVFSETNLTTSRFGECFLVCRTRALHILSLGTNTFITIMPSFPGSPCYIITLQMCLWRRKPSRAFYACAPVQKSYTPRYYSPEHQLINPASEYRQSRQESAWTMQACSFTDRKHSHLLT